MKRNGIVIVMVFIIASICSCGKKEGVIAEKGPVVRLAKVDTLKPSPVEDYYEAVGTVRSKTTSVLSSKIVGNIIAVHIREGSLTRLGQLLIEIDDRDINAQLKKAQAGFREAQDTLEEIEQIIRASESARDAAQANKVLAASTFQRYRALLEQRSVSQQEFDEMLAKNKVAEAEADRTDRMLQSILAKKNQVLARIEQAKAEVVNAQISLSYTRITSPINGVVTVKQADVGTLAAPGAPLLTIEDGAHYRLEATVEESQIRNIRLGNPVKVIVDALGEEISSRVTEVVPTSDPASRSYVVKIDLPAAGRRSGSQSNLCSGLFGKARFAIRTREALLIPQTAILHRGQLVAVYALDSQEIAYLRLIKTGKPYGDRVEVLSGLNNGDRIIVDRVEEISDGNRIQQPEEKK